MNDAWIVHYTSTNFRQYLQYFYEDGANNLKKRNIVFIYCTNKCKFTPKVVAAKLPTLLVLTYTYFTTKHYKANISPVINIETFLAVIVVVILIK